MEYNIDAKNKSLGRLASEIALILRGKNNPKFRPNENPENKVIISNSKDIKYTGNKVNTKIYYQYSGFPGGMKERSLKDMLEKNHKKVLWLAVYRMLPKNRMRDKIIKNLIIN